MYYGGSKEFLETDRHRLAGDTARAATSSEVKDVRRETTALKEMVADLTLDNRSLNVKGMGRTRHGISCVRGRPRSSSWSSSRIFWPSTR